MRTKLLIFLAFFYTGSVYSQTGKPVRWIVNPSFGYTIPITTLNKGFITDDLVGFDNSNIYWQFISLTYYFSNWGLEFSFKINPGMSLNDTHSKFAKALDEMYSENYFLTTSSSADIPGFKIFAGSIKKRSIGPVYKIERDRLFFVSRAMIGLTSFETYHGDSHLKGKGTNERINIDWTTGRHVNDFIAFNPSFALGYRLADRLIINFDLNYWFYNISFEYTENKRSLITNEIQTQKYVYSGLINDLSFGLGLMIVLK